MNAITNSIGMKLVYIPAGTFKMGSPKNEAGRDVNEQQHKVILSKSYHLGQTVVTQAQWERVMGTRPWAGKCYVAEGDDYPAVYVNWDHATEFCRRLTELSGEKKAGLVYRLPTEAEWEYACRAGRTTAYSFGNSASGLRHHAWFAGNKGSVGQEYAQKVGQKQPNGWGLYDMHGNVREWCSDWIGDYPSGSVTNPSGPQSGSVCHLRGDFWSNWARVNRGGCYNSEPQFCRSAFRVENTPSFGSDLIGFRVTCVPSTQYAEPQQVTTEWKGKQLLTWILNLGSKMKKENYLNRESIV